MLSRALFSFLPTILAISFAFSWYFPHSHKLLGWGGDPFFNLWTLEHVWANLSQLGIFKIFSPLFWNTQIFYPMQGTLALSENQIMTGIFSWPIHALTGNGVLTLNIFAGLMSIASFYFAKKFFNEIGVVKFSSWGALFFQCSGWIQNHYAHYQNICIFIFPLALWQWQRFIKHPTVFKMLACGISFGFVAGWNIYFQILLNGIFGCLILHTFYYQRNARPWLILLTGTVACIELPFAMRYFAITRAIGSLAVPTSEYLDYAATWKSFWGHSAQQRSLLGRFFPFYPNYEMSLTKVGFLGFTWVFVWILSLWDSQSRKYAVTAFLFFWIALGPHWGLMHLARLLPGFEGLRALGRIQVLVVFFSLTGILVFFEKFTSGFYSNRFFKSWGVSFALLALISIEIFPGKLPEYTPLPKDLLGSLTSLEQELGQMRAESLAFLIVPELTSELQLALVRTKIFLYNGYTGRIPLNSHLLELIKLMPRSQISTEDRIKTQLIFSGAKVIMSVDAALSATLQKLNFLKTKGCFKHYQWNVCLFETDFNQSEDLKRLNQPRLRLDRDARWVYPSAQNHLALLKANRAGILDFNYSGTCWLEINTAFGKWIHWHEKRGLLGHGFQKVEFQEGDTLMERESKQWIFTLPKSVRPNRTYEVVCSAHE